MKGRWAAVVTVSLALAGVAVRSSFAGHRGSSQWPFATIDGGQFRLTLRNEVHPLVNALDAIGRQCRCAIAFEEPAWQYRGDLDFVPDERSGTPRAIAKRASFSIAHPVSTPMSTADVSAILRELLDQFSAQGSSAAFEIVQGPTPQVVPRRVKNVDGVVQPHRSLLDVAVTLPAAKRRLDEWLQHIASVLRVRSGRDVVAVHPPGNALRRDLIELSAADEPARSVLERLLAAAPVEAAWRLTYVPYSSQFVLSVRYGATAIPRQAGSGTLDRRRLRVVVVQSSDTRTGSAGVS